jgi:sugar O-acyltransferase (sialic acid O-acetyltransferase NeuD family)
MNAIITAPVVTANEDTLLLAKWYKAEGDFISNGDILCGVETTKATVDIEANSDGYLAHLAEEGAQISVGAPIAALTEVAGEDIKTLIEGIAETAEKKRWTKKAALVAKRLGIDIELLAAANGGSRVTEADVLAAHETSSAGSTEIAKPTRPPSATSEAKNVARSLRRADDLHEDGFPTNQPERLILLGGAAGAGAMAVDVLSRTHLQRPVAILDGNTAAHGKTVGGVPVLGGLGMIDELRDADAFDAAIILFTQDVDERAAVFLDLKSKGVKFANLIDPTVQIRGGTTFGEGNLVMAKGYFSTAVTVGDNCFFGSHCVVEHHSNIGSHCAFGPRTTTSGAVTVGDRVKTGMSVSIEPYITIGANSLIASGCVITGNIAANSLVKARQTHSTHERKKAGQ